MHAGVILFLAVCVDVVELSGPVNNVPQEVAVAAPGVVCSGCVRCRAIVLTWVQRV